MEDNARSPMIWKIPLKSVVSRPNDVEGTTGYKAHNSSQTNPKERITGQTMLSPVIFDQLDNALIV